MSPVHTKGRGLKASFLVGGAVESARLLQNAVLLEVLREDVEARIGVL